MTHNIPGWAMKTASPDDLDSVRRARQQSTLHITYPDRKALRAWAKAQGWRAPLLSFEEAFIKQMLENQQRFALGLAESGVALRLPCAEVVLSADQVAELDQLYDERSASGRPSSWGSLVERLRAIRRAIQAGVVVQVEGDKKLSSWDGWYSWAHGRYHMLEDGYDSWIGDDDS